MSEDENKQRDEFLTGLREAFIQQYKDSFTTSDLEAELVLAFHRIDIAYSEISAIQNQWDRGDGDLSLDAAAIAVEVLLGGLLGVKKALADQIKKG